jgi:hypothetical protein
VLKAFQIVLLVIQLVPVIVQAIISVEKAFEPFAKTGVQKLNAVLGIVESAYKSAADGGETLFKALPWDVISPKIGDYAGKLVGAFNKDGWPAVPTTP